VTAVMCPTAMQDRVPAALVWADPARGIGRAMWATTIPARWTVWAHAVRADGRTA